MGLFDPTPGARWARVLTQLEARQALCTAFDAIAPTQIEQIGERMDLLQRRVAAEAAIIEELTWLHELGVLEVVAEVLPTLAQHGDTRPRLSGASPRPRLSGNDAQIGGAA